MTPQQIYTYLVRNEVPEILAASIAEYIDDNNSIKQIKLKDVIGFGLAWEKSFCFEFWEFLWKDITPCYGGQNFWLNPLLLPRKYRPKKSCRPQRHIGGTCRGKWKINP